jgi:hypothetical protein
MECLSSFAKAIKPIKAEALIIACVFPLNKANRTG